jgi:hypothetical protein
MGLLLQQQQPTAAAGAAASGVARGGRVRLAPAAGLWLRGWMQELAAWRDLGEAQVAEVRGMTRAA